MDVLINKKFATFDYLSRDGGNPYFYNTVDEREIMGVSRNLKKTGDWVAHKIKDEDTLDNLALKYYNNPTYWWIIADFNNIKNPLDVDIYKEYTMLKIPALTSITFED